MTTLVQDIEKFCETHGLSEATVGRYAVNDSKFVKRLRGGGRVWPETEKKVRDWMEARAKKTAGAA